MNRHALAIAAAIAVTVACSSTSGTPAGAPSVTAPTATALSASALAGTWSLVSLQATGEPPRAVPPDARYTVAFDGERMSTRADCNTCSGPIALAGASLTIGPALACTRAACPTMAFEGVYEALLGGSHTVVLDGSSFTLQSSRGRLTFAR